MKKFNKNNIPTARVLGFFCTGKDRNGKKFRIASSSLFHLHCINAYAEKKIWAQIDNGQRILIYRW
jgi:hypothetical protein